LAVVIVFVFVAVETLLHHQLGLLSRNQLFR
jgi:hypothetical protein